MYFTVVVFSPSCCFAEQKDRSDPFDIEEVMEEMSKNQREALWLKLASLLRDVLLEMPPERWEEAMDVEPVSYGSWEWRWGLVGG